MGGTIGNAIPLSPYPNIWSHWFTYMFSKLKTVIMVNLLLWWIDLKFRWQNDEKMTATQKTAWPENTEPKSQVRKLSHRELIMCY